MSAMGAATESFDMSVTYLPFLDEGSEVPNSLLESRWR